MNPKIVENTSSVLKRLFFNVSISAHYTEMPYSTGRVISTISGNNLNATIMEKSFSFEDIPLLYQMSYLKYVSGKRKNLFLRTNDVAYFYHKNILPEKNVSLTSWQVYLLFYNSSSPRNIQYKGSDGKSLYVCFYIARRN